MKLDSSQVVKLPVAKDAGLSRCNRPDVRLAVLPSMTPCARDICLSDVWGLVNSETVGNWVTCARKLGKSLCCHTSLLWSAICFKIITRCICGFFPHILAIIPATRYTCVFFAAYTCVLSCFVGRLWGFQVYDQFLTNAHICRFLKTGLLKYVSLSHWLVI